MFEFLEFFTNPIYADTLQAWCVLGVFGTTCGQRREQNTEQESEVAGRDIYDNVGNTAYQQTQTPIGNQNTLIGGDLDYVNDESVVNYDNSSYVDASSIDNSIDNSSYDFSDRRVDNSQVDFSDRRIDNSVTDFSTVDNSITDLSDNRIDNSVTDLSDNRSYDYSDRSTDNSFTDLSDRSIQDYSTEIIDNRIDNSATDFSDRSVDNSFTDLSDRSITDLSDRSFNDYSDRSDNRIYNTTSDYGAVQSAFLANESVSDSAFGFGQNALLANRANTADLFSFLGTANANAFDLADTLAADSQQNALEFASTAINETRDDASQNIDSLIRGFTIVGVAVTAVVALRYFR